MIYNLLITEEMNRLLHESIDYLIYEKRSKQGALHLVNEVQKIYSYLEINPYLFSISNDPFLSAFQYRTAKLSSMNYIIVYKIVDNWVYIVGLYHSLEDYSEKVTFSNF